MKAIYFPISFVFIAGLVYADPKSWNCNAKIDKLLEDGRPLMEKRNPTESSMMFCAPLLLYGLQTAKRGGDVIATEDIKDPSCTTQTMNCIFDYLNFTCTVDMVMFKMMMEMAGPMAMGRKKRQLPGMGGSGGGEGETAIIMGYWGNAHLLADTKNCDNKRKNSCEGVRSESWEPGNMMIGCKGSDPALKTACADNMIMDKIKQSFGEMIKSCAGDEIGKMFTEAGDTASKFSCKA